MEERKIERFGWTFAPGDKVMQIENDYNKEVYNGDIGYIDDVNPDVGELTASFDGRAITYGFGELDTLVPAYARARNHPGHDAALCHAAAKSALYRRHSGQETGRAGRSKEGCRHRGSQRVGASALVEAE
jgi:hypothetical protein